MRLQFYSSLSKNKYGFPQEHNIQQCLQANIEKEKESLDNGGPKHALKTGLSVAFDCHKDVLLKAKLDAYGVNRYGLAFFDGYFLDCK